MLTLHEIINQEKQKLNDSKMLCSILENKRALDIETIKYIRQQLSNYTQDKNIREDINWILIVVEESLKDLFIWY